MPNASDSLGPEVLGMEALAGDAGARALAAIREEAMAIPRVMLRPINIDVPKWVAATLERLSPLETLRGRIAGHNFPLEPITNVRTYALALHEAHVRSKCASRTSPLVEECAGMLKRCKTEALVLVARDAMQETEFARISTRTGHRNHALALAQYVTVFRAAWHRIEGGTTLTLADLDLFKARALELSVLPSKRDEGPERESQDVRLRAFHLLEKALIELRFQVSFLFRYEPAEIRRYVPPRRYPTGRKPKVKPVEKPVEKAANNAVKRDDVNREEKELKAAE